MSIKDQLTADMKQAMKDITYEQCENLARAMAERLKKDRKQLKIKN